MATSNTSAIKPDSTELRNSIDDFKDVRDEVNILGVIKIEFDNRLLFCERCETYYEDYCMTCGMLVNILNRNVSRNADINAQDEVPHDVVEIKGSRGQFGIFALKIIPKYVTFGPFNGSNTSERSWKIKGGRFTVSEGKTTFLNWMRHINPARSICDQNLLAFQYEGNLYYRTDCDIQAGDELLVYFGHEYEDSLNRDIEMDFIPTVENDAKDVFACTFCCLGFSARTHLVKHKTVCPKVGEEPFSIEELAQCPVCKIYLDRNEYFQFHMAYCCDRNVRMCIPLPSTNQTVKGKRYKTRRHQIHACHQCKYKTIYRTDLESHIDKQHHAVKTYKCGICKRRFKTKESVKVHLKNIHVKVAAKQDQKCSARDYPKVRRSTAHEYPQVKTKQLRYKYIKCNYQTKSTGNFKRHTISQHGKVYKCLTCTYRTRTKDHLKMHIKAKHLEKIDYKCLKCNLKTNYKKTLKIHIKTKHLKEFDYKCLKCNYKTNKKNIFENHIKTNHHKEFDYKCLKCNYKTNSKYTFERHMKAQHLKEFDYNCLQCTYKTNRKWDFSVHIKTNHLKEFDYKCLKCNYKTNKKNIFENHIKTNHHKEFDYKCLKCDYKTNEKISFEYHIKTKHLKEFDYKCLQCTYKTNRKRNLRAHIKTRHLKEFDYKCLKCNYKTNEKSTFENHIKTKHLKV